MKIQINTGITINADFSVKTSLCEKICFESWYMYL